MKMHCRLAAVFLSLAFICTAAVAMPQRGTPFPTRPIPLSIPDKQALTRIERYLTAIHTISSEFIQTNTNGDISTGKFYLQRPGKVRMEYNPPTPVLMVTSGSDMVYYDRELDQVTHIPLRSTLVGFLARDQVQFDDSVIITGFMQKNQGMRLSLVQANRSHDGSLTLEFSDNPLTIRNMIITDSSGQVTSVSLNNARFDVPLDQSLFTFRDPHLGGRLRNK